MWNAALGGGDQSRRGTSQHDRRRYCGPARLLGKLGHSPEKIVLSGLAYQGFTHGTHDGQMIACVSSETEEVLCGQERAIEQLGILTSASLGLSSSQHFDSADWQQLIDTCPCERAFEAFAVRAEIERQNDRLRRAGLGRLRWLGRWTLRISIGHGYRSRLAILQGRSRSSHSLHFFVARVPSAFIPTTSASTPAPPPMLFALDTFLPIIDLGVAGQVGG